MEAHAPHVSDRLARSLATGDRPAQVPGLNAHLIGIAGSGMRALADVLAARGWRLSGSDMAAEGVFHLAKAGIRLARGHTAEHLGPDIDVVIHSDAIPPDNPERRRAAELGIPSLSYFQMLGRLTAAQPTIAIAGTHGKSTTTAMAAAILVEAGCDPTVFCGATPLGVTSGGRAGRGELALVEACEYRENFLHLRPRHAAILGIEPDHFDYYKTPADLEAAFARFVRLLPSDGLLLARHACPTTRRVTAAAGCRVETFGFDPQADWSARQVVAQRGRYAFCPYYQGEPLGEVVLRVPGRHNVLNALAAAAVAWHNGAGKECLSRSLGRFRGLQRRLEVLGRWRGVWLVDDYAHHPTEVAAALDAVRRMFPGRRLWCVFQPHQASRTEHLLDELAAALENTERLLVAEIFRAREAPPRPGEVTAADLARAVKGNATVVFQAHDTPGILRVLQTQLAPGDVLVTMGAGDIRGVCDGVIERFREMRAAV